MLSYLSPKRLAELCDGYWHDDIMPSAAFISAQIDSRMMGSNQLFIALKGQQTDGHRFIHQLDPDRQQAAIVEQPAPQARVAQLCVSNSLHTLQTLSGEISALTHAVKFALTGSVGKTGTKDMLCRMLTGFGATHATRENYNNHIGVPLTLAQMPEDTQFLVCELGMNHAGEIAELAGLVKPDVAAITCIADSHIGHFDSSEQIADAKAELFSGLTAGGAAILPRDDAFYPHLAAAAQQAGASPILSFGTDPASTFRLTGCVRQASCLQLTIDCRHLDDETQIRRITLPLPMMGKHWAMNAVCALAMCAAAGLDARVAAARLSDFTDLPGRGKPYDLSVCGHHLALIDDSYNAGPASVRAALNTLAELPGQYGVILSDMLELGTFARDAHDALAGWLNEAGISWVIAVGPFMTAMTARLTSKVTRICHPNTADALTALDANLSRLAANTDILLVKGSHGSGAHLISQHIIKTYSTTPAVMEAVHAS